MSSQTQSPSPSSPVSLSLPTSSSTVNVSILNTTARIDRLPTSYHYPPSHIPAPFTHLNCPCFAFLIEHPPSGQKVLFDLGMRKDWQNLAPSIVSMIKTVGADIKVEKDVSEILEAGGIDLKDIDGIIWRCVFTLSSTILFSSARSSIRRTVKPVLIFSLPFSFPSQTMIMKKSA